MSVLGADDFGVSCEELAALRCAMKCATEDAEEHPNDAWNTVLQGLRVAACYADSVEKAATEEDVVVLHRLLALLEICLTKPARLEKHPKYEDQFLVRCHVPISGDGWERMVRHGGVLAGELRRSKLCLSILSWSLTRTPARRRNHCWVKLSCHFVGEAEKELRKRFEALLASERTAAHGA